MTLFVRIQMQRAVSQFRKTKSHEIWSMPLWNLIDSSFLTPVVVLNCQAQLLFIIGKGREIRCEWWLGFTREAWHLLCHLHSRRLGWYWVCLFSGDESGYDQTYLGNKLNWLSKFGDMSYFSPRCYKNFQVASLSRTRWKQQFARIWISPHSSQRQACAIAFCDWKDIFKIEWECFQGSIRG